MGAAEPSARRSSDEFPYGYELLRVGHLFVDDRYQRPLTRLVAKIVDDFDARLLGALYVSEREANRSYAVMDGQTRWTALRRLGFEVAPCLIYHDLSVAQEAQLFIHWQKDRLNNRPFHRFHASITAEDPESMAIDLLVRATGFELSDVSVGPVNIAAIGALERTYRRGPDTLRRTLQTIYQAWASHHIQATSGEMIAGIGYFFYRAEQDGLTVDDERLVRRLSISDPREILLRASHLRQGVGHGGGSPNYVADVILSEYKRRAPAA